MTYLDILAGRFTPVQYFDIVERSRCSPADRRLLSLACGSFEMAFAHSASDVLAIDSIVKASRHPRKVVWETGVVMLTQLAQTNASAQRELTKMAQDTALPVHFAHRNHQGLEKNAQSNLFLCEAEIRLFRRFVFDRNQFVEN